MGKTEEVLARHRSQLAALQEAFAPLAAHKHKLDTAAGKHATRTIWAGFGYLIVQAGVIFKLTFYSRFGWDVMEPVAYFITFSVGLGGLLFFQFTHIDYTYPALYGQVRERQPARAPKQPAPSAWC